MESERSVDDGQSFEDLVNAESVSKERSLSIIRRATRERTGSELTEPNQQSDNRDGIKKIAALFEGIPEPYNHSVNFQRVIVSDAGEAPDADTVEACKKLKTITEIREKWLSAHPVPPQDLIDFSVECGSPPRKLSSDSSSSANNEMFRRRLDPPYEIFDQPLPSSISNYSYRMVAGVMHVSEVKETNSCGADAAEEVADKDLPPSVFPVISFKEFVDDFNFVSGTIVVGCLRIISYFRYF